VYPSATPAATVREAVAWLDKLIDDGTSAGEIRDDVGTDLDNQLRNLRTALARGPVDLAGTVAGLREKISTRVNEGTITGDYATVLDEALVRLAGAV
jgi:serine/threonine-protein kinase